MDIVVFLSVAQLHTPSQPPFWRWVMLIVFVGLAGYSGYRWLVKRKQRADLDRLLARDPSLTYTVIPCGMRSDQLAWWCKGLPDGDRNNGVRYAVEGPMRVDLGPGMPDEMTITAFEWWWEVESRERSRNRTTGFHVGSFHSPGRTYSERRIPAGLVQLPVTVDSRVMVQPESALGRVGVTRGGHQYESAEFNRRFRVEAMNEDLALSLIDANFQQLMVEHFPGFTVELFGQFLLVTGTPTHRDESLAGVIGLLPALRQDAHRILRAIPPAYWRAIGATRGPR